ncbi:MAG: hypothetical protein HZB26_01825 [Candidatus Hydrogenedentes bacterium]|nr:hypothetical protein [Candidatus Hydrogenedentota bacterium]
MSELIYTFVAYAARTAQGKTCLDGMRLLADIMHPRGIPVTWLVSPESAAIARDTLNEWHTAHGDEVAVDLPPLTGTYAEKLARITELRGKVRQALPWTEATIAGGVHCDPDIVTLLEAAGFEGIWGFCWEQIEVDDITDRGCPWGFYYMDPKDRLRPAAQRSVVAIPWLSHDLVKTVHCGWAPLYNNDPNDMARAGICSWEDAAYWDAFLDSYHENTRYNDTVFLLQHQEAHEMEANERNHCYTPEDIREAAILLERHVDHLLRKPRVRVMSLPGAVRHYRAINPATASSYMLWKDTPAPRPNPDYAWDICPGPWPKTFLYYDCGAQMVFIDGQVRPARILNYGKPFDAIDDYRESHIPRPRLVRNTQFVWRREIEITVTSAKAMPYGLALWGDYGLYQIGAAPGLLAGKILPRELLFLRYDLQPGENRFVVALEGK